MDVPQAMLLDWARRIGNGGLEVSPWIIAAVAREINTYASANITEQQALRQSFYSREGR